MIVSGASGWPTSDMLQRRVIRYPPAQQYRRLLPDGQVLDRHCSASCRHEMIAARVDSLGHALVLLHLSLKQPVDHASVAALPN